MDRKRKYFLICGLSLFIVLTFTRGGLSLNRLEIQEVMTDRAKISNTMWTRGMSHLEPSSRHELHNLIFWLGEYAIRYAPEGWHWKRLWKDMFCIVWQESNFVNYEEQDDETGFGWSALQWSTAKEVAEREEWNWDFDKSFVQKIYSLQAQYMAKYLVYLYEHYDGDRKKAITGYNKGLDVGDPERYGYWKALKSKIRVLDAKLEREVGE